MSRRLDADEISRQLAELPGWLGDGDGLERSYSFPTFPLAISGVDDVAVMAETMNHHPDIDVRWRTVRFFLVTHDAGGVTQLDMELAHRIHETALRLGAT